MDGWLHCLLTNCPETIQHFQEWVLYQTDLFEEECGLLPGTNPSSHEGGQNRIPLGRKTLAAGVAFPIADSEGNVAGRDGIAWGLGSGGSGGGGGGGGGVSNVTMAGSLADIAESYHHHSLGGGGGGEGVGGGGGEQRAIGKKILAFGFTDGVVPAVRGGEGGEGERSSTTTSTTPVVDSYYAKQAATGATASAAAGEAGEVGEDEVSSPSTTLPLTKKNPMGFLEKSGVTARKGSNGGGITVSKDSGGGRDRDGEQEEGRELSVDFRIISPSSAVLGGAVIGGVSGSSRSSA